MDNFFYQPADQRYLAYAVCEYWMETHPNNQQIQAFGNAFLRALEGDTSYEAHGVPLDELEAKLRRDLSPVDALRLLGSGPGPLAR